MADRPLRDWQRMSKYVQLRIQTHPLLEPLRAAGKPPILHAHDHAILVTALGKPDAGGWQIEVSIDGYEWWLPLKRSHGDRLADELAASVRQKWDERVTNLFLD